LLLADEPTGNLDTVMARQVMELLEEIHAGGTTIVMVTHDPELAGRAGRNIHLVDGRVLPGELPDTRGEFAPAIRFSGNQPLAARI
jgi:ABC-type lipoprotein export system ATPase subunit